MATSDARVRSVLDDTKKFLSTNVKDGVHDFSHISAVLKNTRNIISHSPYSLTDKQKEAILLAAILHDVDDAKLFPDSLNYSNARTILRPYLKPEEKEHEELIIFMIEIVSTRKNGTQRESAEEDWMLYPRYADRLEAIGKVGIDRAKLYSYYVRRPLYSPLTKRATNEEELWAIATPERFDDYINGRKIYPNTFIDHLYDKVLHIGKPESFDGCTNPYVLEEAKRRHKIVIDYVIEFGIYGHI